MKSYSSNTVMCIVVRRDRESTCVLILAFLYFTSKPNSAWRDLHQMGHQLGSSIIKNQSRVALSVNTVSHSYMR